MKSIDCNLSFSRHPYWLILAKCLAKFSLKRIQKKEENSFQFYGKHYLQTHGAAMVTKMAVAFANIFMAKVETEILKPLIWKR